MTLRQRIERAEQNFPRLFADAEEREYGTLFYNSKNKGHYDANFAAINADKITDLRTVLNDITAFYQSIGHTPIVRPPTVENYFIDNAAIFKECGYSITIDLDKQIMTLVEPCKIGMPERLDIRRITADDIRNGVKFIQDEEDHDIFMFNKTVENYGKYVDEKAHYIYTGYLNDEPVAGINFHVSPSGITSFDGIGTASAHQGKGYAREIMRHALAICREENLPTAYTWYAHDTSMRILKQGGFRHAFTLPRGYANYARIEHYVEDE